MRLFSKELYNLQLWQAKFSIHVLVSRWGLIEKNPNDFSACKGVACISHLYWSEIIVLNCVHLIWIWFNSMFCCLYSAVVGEVDEDIDSHADFENLRAEPLNPVTHWFRVSFWQVSLRTSYCLIYNFHRQNVPLASFEHSD